MSHQEIQILTAESLQVVSSEDARTARALDMDEAFEDWLRVSGVSQIETGHPATNPSDVAPPAPLREIAFEGTMRINGYAAGIIRSNDGRLIVDTAGEVDADISVHDATIYGCVRGDIRAKRKVKLCGSARVVGDIETVALSIEPGAAFEGRCIFVEASEADETAESTLAATG